MKIVFFAHPPFLVSQSMPKFLRMLADGMIDRGCAVQIWTAKPRFYRIPFFKPLKKWFGYIDQFVIFPLEVKIRLKACPPDTLFVFTDHALGPWVPLVTNRPHVVHCHDFLAQRSALGQISENPLSLSGRLYQGYIRRGYSKAKNFIAISKRTKRDLDRFLSSPPSLSEVVYNGLNQQFEPKDGATARKILHKKFRIELKAGYLLHVGGNSWYKNRTGVIEIYNAWRSISELQLPLLLIGEVPSQPLLKQHSRSPFKNDIHLLSNVDDEVVRVAYTGASVFIFPSIAEGFGWPIAEAMASGCPVITTNAAPMNEVSGNAGFLIPVRPLQQDKIVNWAVKAAEAVEKVVMQTPAERAKNISACIINAQRFDQSSALNKIYNIYFSIVNSASRVRSKSEAFSDTNS